MKPNGRKKLLVFLTIGLAGLVLSGAIAIYVGVLGVRYVASVVTVPKIAEHAETLRSKIETIPTFEAIRCLSAAQSFVDLERLHLTPVLQNLETLKRACFAMPLTSPPSKEKGELI